MHESREYNVGCSRKKNERRTRTKQPKKKVRTRKREIALEAICEFRVLQ